MMALPYSSTIRYRNWYRYTGILDVLVATISAIQGVLTDVTGLELDLKDTSTATGKLKDVYQVRGSIVLE